MVWLANEGDDYDIYYWDARVGGVPQNITNDDYNNYYYPQINNQGQDVLEGL